MVSRMSRRTFLKLALASLASSACAPTDGSLQGQMPFAQRVVAAQGNPVPTSLPSADGTAAAFLAAWSSGDYAAMYQLLTDADRAKISFEEFKGRYFTALREATAVGIYAELRSLLSEGQQATAGFHVDWQTALFGRLKIDSLMPLQWENGHWAVDWSSRLVHPQLNDDYLMVRLDRVPMRGHIYDRNGLGLAVQGPVVSIGVVPGRIKDKQAVLAALTAVTGLRAEDIEAKIDSARSDWLVQLANIDPQVSVANDKMLSALDGIVREETKVRVYRSGTLAAHLIGHMGAIPPAELSQWQARGYRGDEKVGLTGIEGWGESYLAGRRGGRLTILTSQYQEVAQLAEAPARPGDNIYLTIDKGLQADAENILGQRRGALVVLDPNTGFVLAMATYPRFDPNIFVKGADVATWNQLEYDLARPLVDRGSQEAYFPGSVFKLVTMMAGMQKLGLTANSTFTCTGTWNRLGNQFVKTCWKKEGHGVINLMDGLTQSCDVVFYEIGLALQKLDPFILPQVARACGLGKPTGIEMPGEAAGVVPDPDWKMEEWGQDWYPGETVNMAIGQGDIKTTPLQIARLMAAIANRGTLYRPQLVQRIVERGGTERLSQPQVVGQLPATPEQLAVIRSALEGVVSGPGGTARFVFEGASFSAAGKTGTAETDQEKPHAWFAGYSPVDAPQIVVVVILEQAGEGSKEAAPVFRQMVEAYYSRLRSPAVPAPEATLPAQ